MSNQANRKCGCYSSLPAVHVLSPVTCLSMRPLHVLVLSWGPGRAADTSAECKLLAASRPGTTTRPSRGTVTQRRKREMGETENNGNLSFLLVISSSDVLPPPNTTSKAAAVAVGHSGEQEAQPAPIASLERRADFASIRSRFAILELFVVDNSPRPPKHRPAALHERLGVVVDKPVSHVGASCGITTAVQYYSTLPGPYPVDPASSTAQAYHSSYCCLGFG